MLDRETRNLKDLEENEDLIRSGVFAIHYVRENLILDQNSSDSDFFMRDINGTMSKHAIRNLKTKVIDAMVRKAELGWYPSNNIPLGYMNTNKNEFGQKVRRGEIIKPDDNLNNREIVCASLNCERRVYHLRRSVIKEEPKILSLQKNLLAIKQEQSNAELKILFIEVDFIGVESFTTENMNYLFRRI